jgi:hypothetical protein
VEKRTTNRSVRRPGTHYVGLDLKDSVYDRLSGIAEKEQRKVASLIRVILSQYLRAYDVDPKNSTDAPPQRRREDRDEGQNSSGGATRERQPGRMRDIDHQIPSVFERVAVKDLRQPPVLGILPDDAEEDRIDVLRVGFNQQ